MYRKNRVRLNESQLRRIVKESVKRVIRENEQLDLYDNYFAVTLYRVNEYGGCVGFDCETFGDKASAMQFAIKSVKMADFPIIAECGVVTEDDEEYTENIGGKNVTFHQIYDRDDAWLYVVANVRNNRNFDKIDKYIKSY